ncbi:hypothetical protein HaLaN_03711, partial [Haematococcus lacustris]
MLHSPAKVVIRTWRSLHTCGPALADTGISPRGRPGPEAQADTVQEVKDKAKSAAADPAGTLASLGSAVKDAAVWTAQFAKETVTTVAGLGGQVLGNTRDDVLKRGDTLGHPPADGATSKASRMGGQPAGELGKQPI